MLNDEPIVVFEEYEVRPMILTPENVQRFWDKAKKFRTLYGREITNVSDFMSLFLNQREDGQYESNGLFFVINDFLGVIYITDIRPEEDATAHYTFFDRRHHGREGLIRAVLEWGFRRYNFNRLSVEIPCYTTPQTKHFVTNCGFAYEGKRRKAVRYKGDLFDVNLYGILKSEVL